MLLQKKKTVAVHLWIFALLSIWALPRSMAQSPTNEEKYSVSSRAIYQSNHVYLRWEPTNVKTWEKGNDNGYQIIRYKLESNGVQLTDQEIEETREELFVRVKGEDELLSFGVLELEYAAKAVYRPKDLLDSTIVTDPVTKAFQYAELKNNAKDLGISVASSDIQYAEHLGLGLKDAGAEPNSKYRYVIFVSALDSLENLNSTVSVVSVNTDGSNGIAAIENLHVERDDKYIMLKWNKPESKIYNTYDIFKREKGGNTNFEKVNENPYSFTDQSDSPDILFPDSLANNTTIYEYYVQGMTNFGIAGPASEILEVKGKPRPLPTKPFIERIEEQNKGKQLITWSFPDEYIGRIQGFHIRRAKDREEEFITITPNLIMTPNDAGDGYSYLDMFPLGTAYYVVVAIDENGYELASIPKMAQIEDDQAPSTPTGISGTVDLEGFADLKWTANTEPDLLGYQVLFANKQNGDYIPMTEKWVTEEHFSKYVNIETLTEEIWVKVAALDYHQNRSALSAPYRLQLPDIIAPSNPVLERVENYPQCVYIKWHASSSEDVVKHEVQRRPLNYEGDWVTIATYLPVWRADTSHCDTSLQCWMEYEYRIKAVDDADLFSYSGKGVGMMSSNYCFNGVYSPKAFFTHQIPHPRKTAALKSANGFICIYWEFPCDYPVQEFHIYRRLTPGGPFILVRSITPKKAIFTSYYTVPDPNDPSKTLTFGFPNNTKVNPTNTSPVIIDGVPQGGGTTTPVALTPKRTKTMSNDMCAYLIEDDDLAIFNVPNTGNIEYMIQAEFKDGTRSRFSEKIKP